MLREDTVDGMKVMEEGGRDRGGEHRVQCRILSVSVGFC